MIPAVLSWLSCPGCPLLVVLSRLSCPSPVLDDMLWPSSPFCLVLTDMTWLIFPGQLVQTDLSWFSCPSYPVPAVTPWLLAVLSRLSCSSYPVSQLSCPIKYKSGISVKPLWWDLHENLLFPWKFLRKFQNNAEMKIFIETKFWELCIFMKTLFFGVSKRISIFFLINPVFFWCFKEHFLFFYYQYSIQMWLEKEFLFPIYLQSTFVAPAFLVFYIFVLC
jgi:hypothetical protein